MEKVYGNRSDNTERFYVLVDSIEPDIDQGTQFRLDGIMSNWVDENLNQNTLMTEVYQSLSPFFFEIHDRSRLFNYDSIDEIERIWMQIEVQDTPTALPVDQFSYDTINGDGRRRYVYRSEILTPSSLVNLLSSKFSLNEIEEADETQMNNVFKSIPSRSGNYFVGVYYVGQGNLSAICDDSGMPVFYFDVGGGCYVNHATYINPLRMCFTNNQPIILSHWDMDHLETARRDIISNGTKSMFLQSDWLVPNQQIGPGYTKLAHTLNSARPLFKWPLSLVTLNFRFGKIIKCSGTGKNHSGLVLDLSLTNSNGTMSSFLLPADASYGSIPYIKSCYDGLIATHHGAEFPINNAPVCTANGVHGICYSYGLNNSYKHPRLNAENAHTTNGWNNRRDTIAGNVAINQLSAIALQPPCNCGNCDLSITQYF